MMRITPLMIKHRLIERMIAVIKEETEKCKLEGRINPGFIDLAVDFIRTYSYQVVFEGALRRRQTPASGYPDPPCREDRRRREQEGEVSDSLAGRGGAEPQK